jgi:hypothetical protein
MSTDPKIYGEEYVRGRIWSFIRFHKYLREISHIFCEEFQYDKDDIIEVSMSDDSKTVWVHFDSGTIGFASELLWDKNVRETFKKNFEVN